MQANEAALPAMRPSHPVLSPRERQVLILLAEGIDPPTISRMLGLSLHTTRDYLKSIRRKLGVKSQLAAVAAARREGIL